MTEGNPQIEALLEATEQHPQARVALTAALASGNPSHAYLFHGPRGVGKADAARAFGAALLAERAPDPDGAYRRALRGAHQDLTWVAPSGAHEMRLDDVMEPVIRGAARTPMEGDRRVFVLERVETMSEIVANSLLKTIEEPASFVHFVLVTSAPGRVMPTIASRCQAIRFEAIPAAAIAKLLQGEGVTEIRAASCAALSGGDLELARELASDEGDAMRSEAGRIVGCALRGVSGRERPWEGILGRATAAGDLAEQLELEELAQAIEAFPKGRERTAAQKEGEQAAHRTARRRRTDTLDRSLRISALLLRDLAAAAAGSPDLAHARDRHESIVKTAQGRDVGPLLLAAEEVDTTRLAIRRNVSEELALQALSFKLDRLLAGV